MKPFRLLGLQRLRQLQEDQAAAELARRTSARQRSEARARQALEALAGSELAPGDIASWRASVAARVALASALGNAEEAAETDSYRETEAHDSWSAARRRSRSLDRLAGRHDAAEQHTEARTEQNALDELATQRAIHNGRAHQDGDER